MSRLTTSVPAESDILCEHCGYTLNGLPESGHCPECAAPIASSTTNDRRVIPAWERTPTLATFLTTTAEVTFRPTRFYRTLATRQTSRLTQTFADVHWAVAALLFALAGFIHAHWFYFTLGAFAGVDVPAWQQFGAYLALAIVSFAAITATTWLAAKLSAWEGAYHGFRLPLQVVRRGLHYHAAHYLPVALLALATVAGYQLLLHANILSPLSATRYLYTLCAEVVLAAAYLFKTYWIGMRQMMYANR